MSTYSDQINLILDEKLVPKMHNLSIEVARIEPYSYSNTKLEESKRKLDYLSMIYDFLAEYSSGNEELDSSKLITIVRLIDPPSRESKQAGKISKISNKKTFTPFYKLMLDKRVVRDDTVIIPGTELTITGSYETPEVIHGTKTIFMTIDGLLQTSDGFSVALYNKDFGFNLGGTTVTITLQAFVDGVAVTPPYSFIIPIQDLVNNVFYYGVGAQALIAAQIQALSTLYEERGNKTLLFSPNSEVFYFAYPADFGALSSIKDQNGFDVTDDFILRTDTFTLGAPNYVGGTALYNIYEFDSLTTQTNFSLTFNF